jgi:hypothetical protein
VGIYEVMRMNAELRQMVGRAALLLTEGLTTSTR